MLMAALPSRFHVRGYEEEGTTTTPFDMVVLATGLEPQEDAQSVRRMLNMSCGTEG